MVTKTTRTDYKLKNCKINADGFLLDEFDQKVDIIKMLRLIFGVGNFDLSANTSKKEDVDVNPDDFDEDDDL